MGDMIEEVTSLSDYVNKIGEISPPSEEKRNIYYRGQNEDYTNTLPSLVRNEDYLNHENDLINDFVVKYPELFIDCHNNFDRIALMQHHQLPTRLLDLTTNPLVALYFAVEEGNDEKDGKIFPFTNSYDGVLLKEFLHNDYFDSILQEFTSIKGNNRQFLKSPFSDEIEVESSLARLNGDDRSNVLTNLQEFYNDLNEIDKEENGKTNWFNLYISIMNNIGDFNNTKLLESYKFFNCGASTKRLYHEIKKDIYDFDEKINPLELFVPKIVVPRIIDQRIRNQNGLFMFVPFVSNSGYEKFGTKVLNFEEIKQRTQTRIDILRLLSKPNKYNDERKPVTFVIPSCKKSGIRFELKNMGITESFIYPDPSHIAHEISSNYSH